MAKKNKKTQAQTEFTEFKKDYLKFLAKIAKVREKQFLLMKKISQRVDAYKLAKLKEE
ncbi:MAG: hypothetical protein AB1465_06335 [Patescibacteria group bacterium]